MKCNILSDIAEAAELDFLILYSSFQDIAVIYMCNIRLKMKSYFGGKRFRAKLFKALLAKQGC